ncbi:Cytochrome P450 [Kalmanozyma brasiliensis GHG001]|uniref:Cytochrome P450 CYP3/CYP5/CYP6/CYP9 subfamilies n=1 Tax=Kalmanozyma brasiliensis (strain GHG001) TaxID=1365824 RepID=V5EJ88_KALBG|nr:Cytochrome P450 [Kalmanozyma brasiliensis GHG001]EST04800.1 Cytochrome P450 [Kalmanozyma brasiliensis GHG001]
MTNESSVVGTIAATVFTPLSGLPFLLQLYIGTIILTSGWMLYNLALSPLSRYPGPLSARLGIPFWRFYHALQGDYAPALYALHKHHGPIVRIGPTHLSFSDPAAMNSIYSLSDGTSSRFRKSSFYRSFQVFKSHPSIFSERDPAAHSKRRRAVASAYSMNSLVKLEEYVEDVSELLLKRLEELVETQSIEAGGTKAVQLDPWFHFFAMDVVGELAFGQGFNLLHRGKDDERFLTGVLNLSQWGAVAGCLPWVSSWVLWLFPRVTGQPGGSVIGDMTTSRIQTRYAEVEDNGGVASRPDMLTKFMDARDPDTKEKYSMKQVLFSASSVMSAGSDTTATSLTIFFGYLLDNPTCYAKLREEINAAVDAGNLSSPVKYAKGAQLEYLQACIKEALRLSPPISMDLPRYVPAEGAIIGSNPHLIPGGTTVGISPYVLHRNTSAFGPDAESYRPERWLEGGEEGRKSLERYNMTFGGGSRACIGKNISLMELSKVIPEILLRYDIKKPAVIPQVVSQKGTRQPSFQGRSAWFLEAHNLFVELVPLSV